MNNIDQLLIDLGACEEAIIWARGKSWNEIFETCHRGDWLLWLFSRVNSGDKRIFIAKGHCANTVRHLMKDERSKKAVDAAIAFGNGEITNDERLAAAPTAATEAYAAHAASAARKKNMQETADICRKYLPIEIWNIADPVTV